VHKFCGVGDGPSHDPLPEDGEGRHDGHIHGAREIPLHAGLLQSLVLSVVRHFARVVCPGRMGLRLGLGELRSEL